MFGVCSGTFPSVNSGGIIRKQHQKILRPLPWKLCISKQTPEFARKSEGGGWGVVEVRDEGGGGD